MVKINENVLFYSNYDPLAVLTIFSTLSFSYTASIANVVSKIIDIKDGAKL